MIEPSIDHSVVETSIIRGLNVTSANPEFSCVTVPPIARLGAPSEKKTSNFYGTIPLSILSTLTTISVAVIECIVCFLPPM